MKQKQTKKVHIYYKKASGDVKNQYQITSFKLRLYLVRKYIYFYPVLRRNEIKLTSFPQTDFLQSKLKSNQHQGREKMTALQLAKRVIDHEGPCHYRDRAALSNSAHILFEQSSEEDEEHIERPLHNTPDSIQ